MAALRLIRSCFLVALLLAALNVRAKYKLDHTPGCWVWKAKSIRFSVQHRVQRFFHRAADHFSQVFLNLPLVNLDHLAQLRHFCLVTNQTYPSSNVRKTACVIP